jgi:hypothetical protein
MCAITTQDNQLQLPHVSTFELGMGTFINQPPDVMPVHGLIHDGQLRACPCVF